MTIDFRSDQIQTNKIIVTGSTPQKTLLIYGIDADASPNNQGNIDPAVFDTTVVGSDVFLFVSGVIGGKLDHQWNIPQRGWRNQFFYRD